MKSHLTSSARRMSIELGTQNSGKNSSIKIEEKKKKTFHELGVAVVSSMHTVAVILNKNTVYTL